MGEDKPYWTRTQRLNLNKRYEKINQFHWPLLTNKNTPIPSTSQTNRWCYLILGSQQLCQNGRQLIPWENSGRRCWGSAWTSIIYRNLFGNDWGGLHHLWKPKHPCNCHTKNVHTCSSVNILCPCCWRLCTQQVWSNSRYLTPNSDFIQFPMYTSFSMATAKFSFPFCTLQQWRITEPNQGLGISWRVPVLETFTSSRIWMWFFLFNTRRRKKPRNTFKHWRIPNWWPQTHTNSTSPLIKPSGWLTHCSLSIFKCWRKECFTFPSDFQK